jgi:hypothetical protein
LTEAAIRVTDSGTVRECREFVQLLCTGDPLGPAALDEYLKQYTPPKHVPGGKRKDRLKRDQTSGKPVLWYARVEDTELTEAGLAADAKAMKTASKRLKSGDFEVRTVDWSDDFFAKSVKFNDYLVIDWKRDDGRRHIYPRARVLHREPYDEEGEARVTIAYEAPVGYRGRNHLMVARKLDLQPKFYNRGRAAKIVRGDLARRRHEILALKR